MITHRIVALDIKTGVKRWTFIQDHLNFKMNASVCYVGESFVVSGTYTTHMGGKQNVLLNVEELSGDIQWKNFFT